MKFVNGIYDDDIGYIYLMLENEEEVKKYTEPHAHESMIDDIKKNRVIIINNLGGYTGIDKDKIQIISDVSEKEMYKNQELFGVLK